MPKIHTLSPEIVAKTAAGEVVERPASVVKELLENSLDANSTQITIEIEESGLKNILIIDNGEGMDKEDVLECVKPHTTSKIFKEDDLEGIKSLGFRGEALNSISAVSKMVIKSRTKNNTAGNSVEIHGGKVTKIQPMGMPSGTQVEISDLFYNTPARKKFLKSPATEFRHILETIINTALANPAVAVQLKNNGKTVIDLPEKQNLEDRVKTLLGTTTFTKFLPINKEHTHFKIAGYISTPQLAAETLKNQFLFVNGRCVKNNKVSYAVREAYKNLLEPRVHPAFVLFLELPYEMVDVNIHPRKEEVAFYNEQDLAEFITRVVQEILDSSNLTYSANILDNFFDKADPYTFGALKDSVNIWQVREKEDYEEILQVHNLYLVTQTNKGMLLVDQHAAHERILYEQFLEEFNNQNVVSCEIEPVIIELPLRETDLLKSNFENLSELGFEIEEFGPNTFKVSQVPFLVKEQDIEEILNEILTNISEEKSLKNVNKKSLKTISYLACRSAIKAGEYLSPPERKRLLDKLAETKTNYTCPHGRPVKVEIPIKEVAKSFKR